MRGFARTSPITRPFDVWPRAASPVRSDRCVPRQGAVSLLLHATLRTMRERVAADERRDSDYLIRPATVADAPALGRVHVTSWRQTYAGIVPAAFLAGLSPENRAATWAHRLGDPGPGYAAFV